MNLCKAIIVPGVVALGFLPALAEDKNKEGRGPAAAEAFKKLDTDADGKLTLDEYKAGKLAEDSKKVEMHFKHMDKNSDGTLTLDEFKSGWKHEKKEKEEKP